MFLFQGEKSVNRNKLQSSKRKSQLFAHQFFINPQNSLLLIQIWQKFECFYPASLRVLPLGLGDAESGLCGGRTICCRTPCSSCVSGFMTSLRPCLGLSSCCKISLEATRCLPSSVWKTNGTQTEYRHKTRRSRNVSFL